VTTSKKLIMAVLSLGAIAAFVAGGPTGDEPLVRRLAVAR
jgi:hypothetical protein